MSSKDLKPKLRFPQFKEAWQPKQLGQVFTYTPRAVQKPATSYTSIGIRSHFKGTFQKPDSEPEKNDMDVLYEVKENDLIVNITFAWEGAVAIVKKEDEGGLVSHRFPTYVPVENEMDINFFKFLYPTDKFKTILGIISPGGAGRNRVLNKTDFLKIKYNLPKIEEQQKIASFINAVDKKLNALIQKQNLLQEYKRGVMQKIFDRSIRFKDDKGNDFPEWEEKKLENIVDIMMGQSPPSTTYNQNKIGLPLIQGNADIQNKKSKPKQYTSEPTKVCKIDDLLLSVRAPVGMIAKSVHIACIGRGMCALTVKEENNRDFIFQLLLMYEDNWNLLAQGSTFTAINANDIRNLEFTIPKKKEQIKIAIYLECIDNKIAVIETQIKNTTNYKKALMQQMFC